MDAIDPEDYHELLAVAKRHREERDHYRSEVQRLNLQFEEARKIIAEVSYSPEFKKWFYHGKEQDPCGVHAFTAKYADKPLCDHNWVDARNKIVESGEVCLKCFAIRAGNATTDEKREVPQQKESWSCDKTYRGPHGAMVSCWRPKGHPGDCQ